MAGQACQAQGRVGGLRRYLGNKDCNSRSRARVSFLPSHGFCSSSTPSAKSLSAVYHQKEGLTTNRPGYCEGNPDSSASVLFSPFLGSKRNRSQTNYRSVRVKQAIEDPNIQDGKGCRDRSKHFGTNVGRHNRHRGCLLAGSGELAVPYFSGFQSGVISRRMENLCLPVPSVRSIISPLGLHKSNEAYKGISSHESVQSSRLPRRLPVPFKLPGGLEENDSICSQPLCSPGPQDQLQEISIDPVSEGNIFGSDVSSRFLSTLPSRGEGAEHFSNVPQNRQLDSQISTPVRESHRITKLRLGPYSARSPKTKASHLMDELSYISRTERQASPSGRGLQGNGVHLDRPGVPENSGSYESSKAFIPAYDGCVSFGLVRNPHSSSDSRNLAPRVQGKVNQLAGAEGHFSFYSGISSNLGRTMCSDNVRQHYSHRLHSSPGVSFVQRPNDAVNRASGILPFSQDLAHSQTSCRKIECSCRSRLSTSSSSIGVEPRSQVIQMADEPGRKLPGRSVRNQVEQKDPEVCVAMSRSRGSGDQCPVYQLEQVGEDLSVSSGIIASSSGPSAERLQGTRSPSSPILSPGRLVSCPTGPLSRAGPSSERLCSVAGHIQGEGLASNTSSFQASRLDTLKGGLSVKGFSLQAIRIFLASNRDSTIRQYQSVWKRFFNFLAVKGINSDKVSVSAVCNFLASEFDKGRGYRTLSGYRSALRLPLFLCCNLDINDLISNQFLRGLFSSNPPAKAKDMPHWELNTLLSFIQSPVFEPITSVSLLRLTQKTLVLILLASGRRIKDVANISRSSREDSSSDRLFLLWIDSYKPKNESPNFHPESPSIAHLDKNNSHLLCPVRAYKRYLRVSDSFLRKGKKTQDNLWIPVKGSKELDERRLTYLFKSVVFEALQAENITNVVSVGPHQVRKLAASYAFKFDQDLNSVLRVMGFSSPFIFKKNYVASVPELYFPCVLPGGTFYPGSEEAESDSEFSSSF